MQSLVMSPPLLQHRRVSGLSGNEIYCLNLIDLKPGQLCVGNSVMALGLGRGLSAGLATLAGGEVTAVTQLVHRARSQAFERLMAEAQRDGGLGVTGLCFEVINHGGNLEFITLGSTVHGAGEAGARHFSTSGDAQQLYCQVDSGFTPLQFVFGNVAYSIGVGGNILGRLRSLARGEIIEFSEIFDRTRHLALERITDEAKKHGASAVLGIQTTITSLLGTQEMVMVGTAATHPLLTGHADAPVSSDMTPEEMWNMVHLGYMPVRLVMGVSVYSLGIKGSLGAALTSLIGGEVSGLTELLYEARSKALARIEREAERYQADQVIGVKVRIYDLGFGLVELMAIGTAVKKIPGSQTKTNHLPAQAIMQDRETLIDSTQRTSLKGSTRASAHQTQRGPLVWLISAVGVVFYLVLKIVILKR